MTHYEAISSNVITHCDVIMSHEQEIVPTMCDLHKR